MHIFKIRSVTL